MLDSFLNVFFGTLDSLATFVLIYKIFRWPFWRDFNRLLVMAVIIALVSFVDRTVLHIPEFDTAIQLALYITFLRVVIKVGCYYAFPLAVIGYVSFLLIQFTVYPILLATGIVNMSDAEVVSGVGTFIIQAATEVTCFAVAAVLYVMRLGFSYVDHPPHDFYAIERITKLDLAANVLGALAVATFMYWLLYFQSHIFIIITLLAISLAFLLFLARRKDYGA